MRVVSFEQASLPTRDAVSAQVAHIRRKVRGRDPLVRLLAELNFGSRADDFAPVPHLPTRAAQ